MSKQELDLDLDDVYGPFYPWKVGKNKNKNKNK